MKYLVISDAWCQLFDERGVDMTPVKVHVDYVDDSRRILGSQELYFKRPQTVIAEWDIGPDVMITNMRNVEIIKQDYEYSQWPWYKKLWKKINVFISSYYSHEYE